LTVTLTLWASAGIAADMLSTTPTIRAPTARPHKPLANIVFCLEILCPLSMRREALAVNWQNITAKIRFGT
jgi:hypothetical protein